MENRQVKLTGEARRETFLLAEHSTIRSEIDLQIVERRRVEAQTFVGVAAVYAWALTREEPIHEPYFLAVLAVPVFLTIVGFLRWIGIILRTMALGQYAKQTEVQMLGKHGGWEVNLEKSRRKRPIFLVSLKDGLNF